MSLWQAFSSNNLAVATTVLSVLAALTACLGVLQSGRETGAAVEKARAEAGSKISAVEADARVTIAEVSSTANLKIEQAKRDAARANERAASLEKEAAEAKLELGKVKHSVGARVLTQAQIADIVIHVKSKAEFIISYEHGDYEATMYGIQLAKALVEAGMRERKEPFPYNALGMMRQGNRNPVMVYAPNENAPDKPDEEDPVFKVLNRVIGPINVIGMVFDHGQVTHPDYYYIQIGTKSAPYF